MRSKSTSKAISDPRSVSLTKLDIAAEHIRAAVHLFFADSHPAPIYLLASSAREITQAIGDKLSIRTVLTDIAENRGIPRNELIKEVHRFAGFMKHADRNPAAAISLPYSAVEIALQLACHDFGRVAAGMPVEAQVYEAWIHTIAFGKVSNAPLRRQRVLRRLIAHFRGIRTADAPTRRKIGRQALEKALNDPTLQMDFRRKL